MDGQRLHVRIAGSGPPLLLLHGFLGSGESWAPCLQSLTSERTCVLMDLPGHGRSAPPPLPYPMSALIDDIEATLARLQLSEYAVLGYSLGGRIALCLALSRPDAVTELVCESASPGIVDAAERRDRRAADAEWASRIEEVGMQAFVAAWEQQPIFGSHENLNAAARAEQRRIRASTTASGAQWALRELSQGRQPALWAELGKLRCPSLVMAGAADRKYRALAERMGGMIPDAEVRVVSGAGHTIHLEQPRAFSRLVLEFLRRRASNNERRMDVSSGMAVNA